MTDTCRASCEAAKGLLTLLLEAQLSECLHRKEVRACPKASWAFTQRNAECQLLPCNNFLQTSSAALI